MNEVQKWILKADNDLKVAKNEIGIKDSPTDIICFHTQQAVEKFLKAFLVFKGIPIKKTHNLAELIKICSNIDKDFDNLKKFNVHELSIYAIEVRYPDDFYIPTLEEAQEALRLAELTREFVVNKLKEHGFNF